MTSASVSSVMTAAVLSLDPSALQRHRVKDPYSLHRLVYSLFPDVRDAEQKSASVASGILYVDKGGDARGRKVLLMADRHPNGEALGFDGESLRCKPVPEGFLQHRIYRFETVVNPTRRDSQSRKLLPVKSRPEIAAWFSQTAARSWGFGASEDDITVEETEVLRFGDKHKNPVTLARARITGTLTVTDRLQFQQSFCRGIGRGRSFGCGLLQIVPVVETPFG